MLVWLISPYGPIPGEAWRETRSTMLGRTLAEGGHDVVWWTSAFSHDFKRRRSATWSEVEVQKGFVIRLVPAPGYTTNTGLGRFVSECVLSARLLDRAGSAGPPDVIVANDPPQTSAYIARLLARRFSVPLVLDVIDLWPELFTLVLPRMLRPLGRMLFWPLYRLRELNHADAAAVIAVTESYAAASRRVRARPARTIVVPWGVDCSYDDDACARETAAVRALRSPAPRPAEIRVIYAGKLGDNYDVGVLLRAAEQIERTGANIRVWIAGDGPRRAEVERFIGERGLRNTVYLGCLQPQALSALYRDCDIGLCVYKPESTVEMPIKFFDYASAGLAIVSSLAGDLSDLLRNERIGVNYAAGSPDSLADAIMTLASSEAALREMKERSRIVGGRYGRREVYRDYVRFLEGIAAETPTATVGAPA